VLGASDVRASIRFYESLGFGLIFTDSAADPKYAAVRRDGVELHLQWHADARWDGTSDRPTYRFVVPQVDELSAEFDRRRSDLDRTKVRDTPWGTREFHVRDPDGNGLHFYRAL
jgi:catechol 2,3-dioxygenase-like lactoylglutathione lyase family enzyme